MEKRFNKIEVNMHILKDVPNGQTKESFVECKILNLERLVELYSSQFNMVEVGCLDPHTQVKIYAILVALQNLNKEFHECKV